MYINEFFYYQYKGYTANWTPIPYTITYNLNGGSITGQRTSYNIESSTYTLPTPTRSGYVFVGWTGTGLSSVTSSVTITKGSTGNRTYTANWKVGPNLYYNGNEYTTVTGGWISYVEQVNGAVAKTSSALRVYYTAQSFSGSYYLTKNNINFYGYSKICVNYTIASTVGPTGMYTSLILNDNFLTDYPTPGTYSNVCIAVPNSTQQVSIGSADADIYVTRVWLQ